MEQDIAGGLSEYFGIKMADIKGYSPLVLAYIGDGIFDVIIRTIVVTSGNIPVNIMHSHTSHIVKAASQAKIAENILALLEDDELLIYKRGRNAKSHTTAKNADVIDYRKATGLETLVGYLYLKGKTRRLVFLIKKGLEATFGDKLLELKGDYNA